MIAAGIQIPHNYRRVIMDYRVFLDTANVKEIEDALSTGIVHGIATNPNKMATVGRKYEDVIRDIRSADNHATVHGAVSF